MGQIKKDSRRAEWSSRHFAFLVPVPLRLVSCSSNLVPRAFSAEEETTMCTIQKFTKHALKESSSFLQQIKADLIHANGLNQGQIFWASKDSLPAVIWDHNKWDKER